MKYITSLPASNQPAMAVGVGKYRKEKHFSHSLMVMGINSKGEIRSVIDARFYHTQARNYCVVWLHFGGDFYRSGGSYVGGTGYHMDSAALHHALINCGAGVNDLEGRGGAPMESALLELAEAISVEHNFNYSNFKIFKAHG